MQQAYEPAEAENIAALLFEDLFALRKTHIRLLSRTFSTEELHRLEGLIKRLLTHEPVQYVLGYAYFYKYRFKVNAHTLIPRPETEELVLLALDELRQMTSPVSVIDIGTGSGCIAVSLKKEMPSLQMYALDVSPQALAVAQGNALNLKADIQFIEADFTSPDSFDSLPEVKLIVSNPPYIAASESQTMFPNVLKYEPHLALFVPDTDPLLFYRQLAAYGQKHKATILVEINERLGKETAEVFTHAGYTNVSLHKDLQGKERMIKAFM